MAMAFARMARQRHVVGPALLAASTLAFVPRATVCRGADRFFASQQGGDDDDVARLRRENAELKSKLARQKEPSESGGFLEGLARTFGFGKTDEEKALEKQKKQMDNAIDEVFKGGGLVGGLMGSLAKGVVGAAGKMFAETQGDMDSVLRAIENRLRDRLGDDVQCSMPMQQMYSSSNINGNVVKQVQLVTSAQGSRGSGVVRATASIDGAGNVSINSLDVDGSSVAGSVRGSSGGKNDVIIDV